MEPAERPYEFQDLLADYVLGNLTPADSARVQTLLTNNPEMIAELQRLQSTLAILPLSLPHSVPSQGLEAQILQAAQPEMPSIQSPSPDRSFAWKWLVMGSVAAALIAGLGVETYRLRHNLALSRLDNRALQEQLTAAQTALEQLRHIELAHTRQELSRYQEAVNLLRQPDNRYLVLKGMIPELPSTGSLVIVPSKRSAILALREVAPLPEGQIYRMWALVDGQKVSCGDFRPNAEGQVFLQLPLNEWGETPEVVITIEPDRNMPEPMGDMVIVGS